MEDKLRKNMSYKKRTLIAIQSLIDKYKQAIEDKDYRQLCTLGKCELCAIYYWNKKSINCVGCVSADIEGLVGCNNYSTYKSLEQNSYSHSDTKEATVSLYIRIEFWNRVLDKINNYHSSLFTPKGWKHFNIVVEIDKKLAYEQERRNVESN